MAMVRSGIGDKPKRREDARFLTGRGGYLDDLAFDGLAHAVVLRSPHAHALIGQLDTAAAQSMPGMLAVLTAEDVRAGGLLPLRPTAETNAQTGERFAFMPQPLLADGRVRYAGEPVALIVADTRNQALDAAEAVAVDYMPLPALTTLAAARAPDAPQLAAEAPGNLCFDWRTGDSAAVEAAFAAAAHIVELSLDNHRIVTNPIELRGVIGVWDAEHGRYTAYVSSQNIHVTRDHAARALGVPPAAVRFVAPDVGGGFGAKNFIYPEHVLMLWAARRVGRQVKWIASRSEVFLADHQARDQSAEAALALDAQGRFLALRVESAANAGAYLVSAGGVQTFQYAHLPGTVYRIPA
ncbi:MAG: molybdopterin cofactor-binding domain-containing protein, partial [Stellaceae bacterium]